SAPRSVARGVLEGATRAWWLLDPALDTTQRAARGLATRIHSFQEEAKIEREARPDPQRPSAIADLAGLTQEVERFGFTLSRNGRNEITSLGLPMGPSVEPVRHSISDLAAQLLSYLGHDRPGSVVYR